MIKEEEVVVVVVVEDFIASRDNFVAMRQASSDAEDDDDACDSIDLHLSTTVVVVSSGNVSLNSVLGQIVFILSFDDDFFVLLLVCIIHG